MCTAALLIIIRIGNNPSVLQCINELVDPLITKKQGTTDSCSDSDESQRHANLRKLTTVHDILIYEVK